MARFAVVCIRRVRSDYLVEAADERDAWNRVAHFETARDGGVEDPLKRDAGVREVREPMEVQFERFVVAVGREEKE